MAPRTSTSSQTQTRTETLNPKPDITATRFTTKPPKPKPPVCFSFAAYSKAVIHHLTSLNIPILPGLTDQEIASVESAFFFTFPPDLRAILQVGLPVGSHFPNWRSSSPQQLHILLSLPVLNLSKNISCNGFWSDSWGPKPGNEDDALSLVKLLWQNAPVLVPIYKNCYIPSTRPNMAGNPVFYIDSDDVRVLSFDLAGFFQRFDSFLQVGGFEYHKALGRRGLDKAANVPAWAAKVPRRIDFWTEVAERGRRMVPRADTRGWWCGNNECLELRTCLEEVFWRLRDGGWREEEVKEMMMVDGCDDGDRRRSGAQSVAHDQEGHVKGMSRLLLHAGWTREDVVYSLDLQDDVNDVELSEGKSRSEFHLQNVNSCSKEDGHQESSIKQLMHPRSLGA